MKFDELFEENRFAQGAQVMYQGKPCRLVGFNIGTHEVIINLNGRYQRAPVAELEYVNRRSVEFR